jgi:hypothetical protein
MHTRHFKARMRNDPHASRWFRFIGAAVRFVRRAGYRGVLTVTLTLAGGLLAAAARGRFQGHNDTVLAAVLLLHTHTHAANQNVGLQSPDHKRTNE